MSFKHIVPITDILHCRFGNAQVITPPVWEPLQSGTLGWSQPADGVSALNSTGAFGNEGGLKFLFKGGGELCVLALVESVPANAVANSGGVFVITGKHRGSLILGNLGEAAGGHSIDGMAVDCIEGEADIFIDAVTLGAILVIATDHRTLDSVTLHNSNAALVTSGVATVAIKSAGGFSFIDSAVRIVRLHSIAFFGANAISLRFKQCLVVVTGKCGGFICLDERPLAATFTAGADLHNKRHIVAACPHTGGESLNLAVLGNFHSAVGRMVFQGDCCGNNTRSERGRGLFLIADAATLGRMLGAEPCGLQNARRVVGFSTERGGYIIRHIHTLTALVI